MTKARVRDDLKEQGLTVPVLKFAKETGAMELTYIEAKAGETFTCFQPEELDDEEYNLIVVSKDGTIYFGNSIDFDYQE